MSQPDLHSLRAGRPDCPSDFALDRLHAGELPPEKASDAERHVAGCADCGVRMAERRAGFGAIEGVDPRAMLARIRTGLDAPERAPLSVRLTGWLRRLLGPAAVLAAAGIAFLVINSRQVEPSGTRLKGSLALHVFRLEGERSVEMSSGDTFAPGDRLRFVVDLPTEGYVTVLGVEASGALYTAWPLDPALPTRLPAGRSLELPGAVALDDQPGRETLYLMLCPPEAGPPSCRSAGPGEKPVCPAGCLATPFVVEKKP